jgi:hypothetical protein
LSGFTFDVLQREISLSEAVLLLRMSILTLSLGNRLALRVVLYMTLKLTVVLGLFIMVDTSVLYAHSF